MMWVISFLGFGTRRAERFQSCVSNNPHYDSFDSAEGARLFGEVSRSWQVLRSKRNQFFDVTLLRGVSPR